MSVIRSTESWLSRFRQFVDDDIHDIYADPFRLHSMLFGANCILLHAATEAVRNRQLPKLKSRISQLIAEPDLPLIYGHEKALQLEGTHLIQGLGNVLLALPENGNRVDTRLAVRAVDHYDHAWPSSQPIRGSSSVCHVPAFQKFWNAVYKNDGIGKFVVLDLLTQLLPESKRQVLRSASVSFPCIVNDKGIVAQLTVELFHSKTRAFYPNVASLGLTSLSAHTNASVFCAMNSAWDTVDVGEFDGRWSVTALPTDSFDLAVPYLAGQSCGAAAACAISAASNDLVTDQEVAISASIDSNGKLHGVSEIQQKLKAATKAGMTHVIVANDHVTLDELGNGKVIPAATLCEAFDHLTAHARVVGAWRQSATSSWLDKWQDRNAPDSRPRYIHSQRLTVRPSVLSNDSDSTPQLIARDEFLEFVLDSRPSRILITSDAGMGKSTLMSWCLHATATKAPLRVPVIVDLSVVRGTPDTFFQEVLVPTFMKVCDGELPEPLATQVLFRLRDQGRLVLLLDGLDQAAMNDGMLDTIRDLISGPQWKKCPVVLTSRPHALSQHADSLGIVSNNHRQDTHWLHFGISEFSAEEQVEYLEADDKTIDDLPLSANVLGVPRILECVRIAMANSTWYPKNATELYWSVMEEILTSGLKANSARQIGLPMGATDSPVSKQVSFHHATKLLAALAFEMTIGHGGHPPTSPGDIDGLLGSVFERVRKPAYDGNFQLFMRDISCLVAMDETLVQHTDVIPANRLSWKHRGLQEFFSAIWLANFGNSEDVARLGTVQQKGFGQFAEMWRHLTLLPNSARSEERWLQAVALAYQPTVETPRPTEILCRSWSTLKQYEKSGSSLANKIVSSFQSEVRSYLAEDNVRRTTANALLGNFVSLPVRTDFVISRIPVTVDQYRLFDRSVRRASESIGSEPVVVNWYDAMAFCQWLNCRLPNQDEWEFVDMHGNIWEWCNSWHESCGTTRAEVVSPSRILRGGAYSASAKWCRANRHDSKLGFRIVRSLAEDHS